MAPLLGSGSCKYAPGPILVEIEIHPDAVLLTVWDSSTTGPVTRPMDPNRIGRRGMEIVLALCDTATVRTHPVGKKIIARLLNPDAAP